MALVDIDLNVDITELSNLHESFIVLTFFQVNAPKSISCITLLATTAPSSVLR